MKTKLLLLIAFVTGLFASPNPIGAQDQSKAITSDQTNVEVPSRGLSQRVTVLVDPISNTMTLIGSREDIELVRQTILSLRLRLSQKNSVVTEKVVLKCQLADAVSNILLTSLNIRDQNASRLKVSPVHFPEAILLSGPANDVQRANHSPL